MPKKPFEPNFNTPDDLLSKEELNKIENLPKIDDVLGSEFRDEKADISWEAEQLAKSMGIYLEFDRAQTGKEKDWMYMIRISNPGGGPVTREEYAAFDDLSRKHTKDRDGVPSIRLTTRQAIQYHWIDKKGVLDIVKTLAELKKNSLNACGDNTRNTMACPLSNFSKDFNAVELAHKLGDYFQLPIEPFIKIFEIDTALVRKPGESFKYGKRLLNRKFKIAVSSVRRDENNQLINVNTIEALTNDMAVVPVIENNKVTKYQIYIGGGQGERNGKPSTATLGKPLCLATDDNLMKICDGIVAVHQQWGDRQNRHWARLKYVVKKQGIAWFRDQLNQHLGFDVDLPIEDYDVGPRELNHGWQKQESNGLWAYGIFLENGRVIDTSPNGKLQSMLRHLMDTYPVELMVTANQDAVITNIPEDQKDAFEADLAKFGYGQRDGKDYSTLRKLSGACVGRDTCRLTYTDSEKFEPLLIDELESMGWGDVYESIGITGCERQCFRPGTKTIGLVGTGLNRYMFKLGGSEDGRHQGLPLISSDGEELHLRSVPREQVAVVIDALFKFHQENKQDGEDLGAFHRRIGNDALIAHLKENTATAELMQKPFNTTCVID